MIIQTQASMLTQLMTTDCRDDRQTVVDAVKDALIMARELAQTPIEKHLISNDRTTLPDQKRF